MEDNRRGRPPKVKGRKDQAIQIRVTPGLHSRIQQAAEKDHRSVAEWIRVRLLEALDRQQGE